MKQLMKIAMFASSLAALNACGSNAEKKEQSETAGASSSIDFSLGRYLSSQQAMQVQVKGNDKWNNKGLIKASNDGLSIGGKKSLLVNSNIVFKGDTKAVSAQYFIDAVIMDKFKTRAFEALARADISTPGYSVEVRNFGKSVYKDSRTSEYNYKFTREIGYQAPIFVVPGLELSFGGAIVGELNGKVKPILNVSDRTAEIQLTPSAGAGGSIEAGASVIFARAAVEGSVKVLEGSMPIRGGIALVNGSPRPTLKLEPLSLNALSGNVDLKASLSIGNVLPSPARKLWEDVFGDGLTWKYPVLRWDGFEVVKTKGYDLLSAR